MATQQTHSFDPATLGISNDTHLSENAVRLFEWYVLGTPAIGVSAKSAGFIKELGIASTLDAEAFFSYLQSNKLEIKTYPKAENLLEAISAITKSQGDPWLNEEGIHMVITNSNEAATEIEELSELQQTRKSQFKRERTEIIKRRFFLIDCLFRHFRNSLAHGRYLECSVDGSDAIFSFDVNQYGKVSALFCLKFQRLAEWHNQIERLKHSGRSQ